MNDATRHPLPSSLIHDLRTPLNQIIGYSEMLLEQAQETQQDDFVADLAKVRAAGGQLLSLINDHFDPIRVDQAVAAPVEEEAPLKIEEATHADFDGKPVVHELSSGEAQGLLLVVDDIAANRDVLCRRLKRQGYATVTAENGLQALEILRSDSFDMVLLDIMMPEMDGFETLRRIKADEHLQHLPVIMISALSELDSVIRCIEMGAEDYLFKPFNPVLLKARIGASLEKKRAHDRETRLFEQLQQNFKRLQDLEKLRDDLTNMIIHDLRTPLSSVIMGMQTLDAMGDLNTVQREMMNIAVSGGQTLLGMINDLLDVEKLESGTMQLDYVTLIPMELMLFAEGQVTSLSQSRQLQFVCETADDLPSFQGDENKLRRTLVNLLGNAIKFTPSGGTVTIEARLGSQEQEPTIMFSVRDTGEGIPAESFGRIFEKFGQVESRRLGRVMSSGLGLTFCKLAVEAHGGHIKVESTPGQGSTFSFSIPIAAVRRPSPTP